MGSPADESITRRLAAIMRGGGEGLAGGDEARPPEEQLRFVVLHERGEPFAQLIAAAAEDDDEPRVRGATRTVLVVGDHIGFTEEEEEALCALDAKRASLGPVPLLASHCIVLAHAALDAAAHTRLTE